jgi:hypothetical protein
VDYVASLHDGHVFLSLTSRFVATLNFSTDIYDGKVLIEGINRSLLPASDYPFQIGDEVVSVDGSSAEELIRDFSKYVTDGNVRSTRRSATELIPVRPQSIMPHAPDVGDKATVVIRRSNDDLETYLIPWTKTGVPLLQAGLVPNPKTLVARSAVSDVSLDYAPYLRTIAEFQIARAPIERGVSGFGALRPIFALPSNFKQRLGANSSTDAFYSGTYDFDGYRMGFIRIPHFAPSIGIPAAIQQFEKELAYFQENTDGLIVDDMRNTGEIIYYGVEIARRLIGCSFRAVQFDIRATAEWIRSFSSDLDSARARRAPQYVIDTLEMFLKALEQAYAENRGLTGPLPLNITFLNPPLAVPSPDVTPAGDAEGRLIAYTKPVMVLIDEFSVSTGDMFPAMMQDANAALLFGMRTNGMGGTNAAYNAGAYSEVSIGPTRGLAVRKDAIATDDSPTAPFIENIGVRPEIVEDYMTKDNLLHQGATYIGDFSRAMVDYIRSRQ